MKALFSLFVFWAASPLFATTTVSTSCSPGAEVPGSSPAPFPIGTPYSECRTSDATGDAATAFTQVYYMSASQTGGWNTLNINQSAFATHGTLSSNPRQDPTGTHIVSTAQASFSYDQTFETTGPVRQGYLQLNFTGYTWGMVYDGTESVSASLAPVDNPVLTTLTCSMGQGCALPAFNQGMIPYTLGTTFDLTASGRITANADFANGFSGGQDQLGYQLRFLEADGVTPVSVSSVDTPPTPAPEPATLALIGLPLAVALIAIRKRLTSHQ